MVTEQSLDLSKATLAFGFRIQRIIQRIAVIITPMRPVRRRRDSPRCRSAPLQGHIRVHGGDHPCGTCRLSV